MADYCDCAYCRNFTAVVEQAAPPDVLSLLREMGVNPLHPSETSPFDIEGDGHCLYLPWYHVAGELISPNGEEALPFFEGCAVYFSRKNDLVADSFPRPCFQADVAIPPLPWILEERP